MEGLYQMLFLLKIWDELPVNQLSLKKNVKMQKNGRKIVREKLN